MNPFIAQAVNILCKPETLPVNQRGFALESVDALLCEAESPITSKYKEKLFDAVIKKGHIDFGDIPASKGDIKKYSGYENMMEVLDLISALGTTEKSNAVEYAADVRAAIGYISGLAALYGQAFSLRNEYIMLEYNTYVYTCVEATTTLIYEFVEWVKRPDSAAYTIALKNTPNRASAFYFDQLRAFNNVQRSMGQQYRKMLETMLKGGKNNFTGVEVLGVATVSVVALAIVPITRELIYRIYALRADLTNELELQASFLEMNRACVQSNSSITADKKKAILKKQETLRKDMLKLADIIRIRDVKASKTSQKEISTANSKVSVDSIRNEVNNSPFTLM